MTTDRDSEIADLRDQIAQYESWFRAIDRNSNFDFWFKNTASKYTYVNPHFAKNMGREVCNLQDTQPEEIFDAERLERVKALDKQVMDDGYLKRIIPCTASGTLQMHEEHRFAVTHKDGSPAGLGCFAFEITEKSLAEETLDQAEKIAGLCSWRWSSHTNLLVSCSDQLAEFLGVSITEAFEVFPKRAETLVFPEDRHVFKVVEDHINGLSNNGYEIEYRMRRPDGYVIHIREKAEAFAYSETGKEYLGVMQDITGQKFIEAALKKTNENLETKVNRRTAQLQSAKDKAENANKAKSQFLATISHELRTPMNGVLGMTQVLQDTPLNDDQKDLLQTINDSGTALITIINDILDYSKIEFGVIEFDPQPFSLRDAIENVVVFLKSAADEKGLDLSVKFNSNVPQTLIGDAARLRQIFVNLVGNAIKFTSEGHVSIEVDAKQEGGASHLSVKIIDTGIGIEADKHDLIFEGFTQAEQSLTREYGGTGLGLSITKKIVQAMPNGDISVDSAVGEGSVFTVSLTLDNVEDKLEVADVDAVDVSPTAETHAVAQDKDIEEINIEDTDTDDTDVFDTLSFEEKIILTICPDENRARLIKTALSDWGLNFIPINDVEQVIRVLNETRSKNLNIDAVIIDHDLGLYSGQQLVRTIQAAPGLSDLKTVLIQESHKTDIDEIDLTALKSSLFYSLQIESLQEKTISKITASTNSLPLGAQEEGVDERAPAYTPSVLLVDDNEMNLKVLAHMLGPNKFNIDTAKNGKVACDMAQIKSYDLIFMDMSMPVMGGIEATQTIQKYNRDYGRPFVPIIAVTAQAMKEDEAKFLQNGLSAYLPKPINKSELDRIVEDFLGFEPAEEEFKKYA